MNGNWVNRSEKLSDLGRVLRRNFELWNYREVLLPSIEGYDEALDKGTKFTDGEDFYLVKPDITSQILTKLNPGKSYKLFYISEVLDGKTDGNWQFGAEYIGGDERWMIIEIITAVITGLESLGIRDFFIDIGSRAVWESVTSDLSVEEDVFNALYHRSFDMIDDLPIDDEKKNEIWELFNYRDKTCEYERLNGILEILDDDRLYADFGTVRGMSYYEDLTFEIYAPEVGSPLGGGGEYSFHDEGACGFAFNLDNLAENFPGPEERPREEISLKSSGKLKRAKEQVEAGNAIEVI